MANAAIIVTSVGAALAAILLAFAVHSSRVPRTGGRNLLFHVAFAALAALTCLFVPIEVGEYVFSRLGVIVVGAVFPIYESVRAVCTPQTDDDTIWLQYWAAQGAVYFTAAYLKDYVLLPDGASYVARQVELFFYLWLFLPYTDGSAVVYDFVTKPLLMPVIKPAAKKMGKMLSVIANAFLNAAHLWVVWVFFLFLPDAFKRLVAVAVGISYPLLASVVAINTEETDDDTFWLTYWTCFGVLFLLVDCSETWLGIIPGFYVAVLLSEVYLMLPMFGGADKLFRNILVPLAGMKEMLVLRDALQVKKDLIKSLPPGRQEQVRQAIAESFASDTGDEKVFTMTGGARQRSSSARGFSIAGILRGPTVGSNSQETLVTTESTSLV